MKKQNKNIFIKGREYTPEELKKYTERLLEPIPETEGEGNKELSLPENITKSDYIQIPNTNTIIAIEQSHNNMNYEDTHKALLKESFQMPYINEFMLHFQNIIHSYKNKKPVFNAENNPITEKQLEDLYKFLTTDFNNGCRIWLNAKFKINENQKLLEKVTGIDSNNNLIYKTEDLENYLAEDCYIDFNLLNSQGFPNKKHSSQNYLQGENIYFWKPKNEKVARFFASSDWSILDCGRYPSISYSSLGVFKIVQSTQKNLGE